MPNVNMSPACANELCILQYFFLDNTISNSKDYIDDLKNYSNELSESIADIDRKVSKEELEVVTNLN